MSKKLPPFVFTTRLLITTIKLDSTLEIVFNAKYYDVEAGHFRPAQLICDPALFSDLVGLIAPGYPQLFTIITDTVPHLTTDPFIIDLDVHGSSGVTLDGGIFGLDCIEFFDHRLDNFVDTVSNYDREENEILNFTDDGFAIPSKLNPTRATFYLFDFVPCTLKFNPRQQWAKDIGENHKFMPFANQVAYLQVRYRFYLHLRSKGNKIGAAKRISCLRPSSIFTLARTIYSLSSNPNNFNPD